MKIEIDLSSLGFHYDEDGDPVRNQSLEDAIVIAAANQLLSKMDYEARARIQDYVESAARTYIAEVVDAALAEPIQRHQPWGDKIGEPVTIKEIVRVQLEKFMGAPSPTDRYGRSTSPANLTELVEQVVKSLINNELATDIRKIKQEVSDQLRTKALAAAVAALKP